MAAVFRHCRGFIAGDKHTAVRPMSQLREINLGQWEGLPMAHVRRHFPEEWARRGEDISSYKPPGGECFGDLHNRVLPAVEDMVARLGNSLPVLGQNRTKVVIDSNSRSRFQSLPLATGLWCLEYY